MLDPACYYTTPGLSWDAMLKYTQAIIIKIKNKVSNLNVFGMMRKDIHKFDISDHAENNLFVIPRLLDLEAKCMPC